MGDGYPYLDDGDRAHILRCKTTRILHTSVMPFGVKDSSSLLGFRLLDLLIFSDIIG